MQREEKRRQKVAYVSLEGRGRGLGVEAYLHPAVQHWARSPLNRTTDPAGAMPCPRGPVGGRVVPVSRWPGASTTGCRRELQARWLCTSGAKELLWVARHSWHSFLSVSIAMEIVSWGSPNFPFINQLGSGFALGCLFPQHCSGLYYFLHDKLTTAGPVLNC